MVCWWAKTKTSMGSNYPSRLPAPSSTTFKIEGQDRSIARKASISPAMTTAPPSLRHSRVQGRKGSTWAEDSTDECSQRWIRRNLKGKGGKSSHSKNKASHSWSVFFPSQTSSDRLPEYMMNSVWDSACIAYNSFRQHQLAEAPSARRTIVTILQNDWRLIIIHLIYLKRVEN